MKILVFVPGVMGTAFRYAGTTVWPPNLGHLIFGYGQLDRLLHAKVQLAGVIRQVGIKPVYRRLLDDFQQCGFQTGSFEKRLVEFEYDWRQPNDVTAMHLAEKLDVVTHCFRRENHEIYLIGHSMGGLILRYLLESGVYADRTWMQSVRWCMTLGTPHLGSPLALHYLQGGRGMLGMSRQAVKELGNREGHSSLAELAGPPESGYVQKPVREGRMPETVEPFSDVMREMFGLDATNLGYAAGFWQDLKRGAKPPWVAYHQVASSAHRTMVGHRLCGEELMPLYRANAGDGTVPLVSALQLGSTHGYAWKRHDALFLDRGFRGMLYRVLGAPAGVRPQSMVDAVPVGDEAAFGISLDREECELGESVEITLSYNRPRTDPFETFRFQPVDPHTGEAVDHEDAREVQVQLRGASLWRFQFQLEMDLNPGVYRLESRNPTDDPEPVMLVVRDFRCEMGRSDLHSQLFLI